MRGKPVSWSTLFVIVVVVWFLAKGNTGGGNTGPTNPNPNHGTSVCNEYFKGGC